MTLQRLLTRLRELDVNLWVEGDKLRYSAPEGVLTEELLGELAASKKAVVEWLNKAVADSSHDIPAIQPASREQPIPASFSQERLLFIQELLPDTNSYNLPLTLRLKGVLDLKALD